MTPACGLGRVLHEAQQRSLIPVSRFVTRLGISRRYWYMLLAGERVPAEPLLRLIAAELGLDVDVLRAEAHSGGDRLGE